MKPYSPNSLPLMAALCLASALPVLAGPKVLLDFGTSTSGAGGADVAAPDANGNYWNGINTGAFYSNLLDTAGAASTIDFGFDGSGGGVATGTYNGPAGATSNPPLQSEIDSVEIDSVALGDLGLKEAAFDWVSGTGGRFQIQGLSVVRRYQLSFFGSARFQSDNTSQYRVYDDVAFSNLIGSADLEIHDAASPWLHNQDKVAVITGLIPDQSHSKLYVEFEGAAGGNSGKINAMSIEDAPNPEVGAAGVFVDFGNGTSFSGVEAPSPDENGNTWNSVAPGTFWENLEDRSGAATTIDLGFTTGIATGSYNGPAGVTSNPVTPAELAATDIDAEVLGDFGVKEVGIDFVGTPNDGDIVGISIAGLQAGTDYNLLFYSSRKFATGDATLISVYDDDQLTTFLGETEVIHGVGGTHNPSVVVAINDLTASDTGTLYVEFQGATGGRGYLNAMAIDPVQSSDTTPPIITINGDNPAEVEWGSSYVDAGATATDDVDGTVSVTPSGSVDTSILGSYTIDYSAIDAAGNVATESRTVNVVLPPDADVPGADGLTPTERYAFGGSGPADPVEIPSLATVGGDLVLTAVIRTNDSSLTVIGESSTDLSIWNDLVVNPEGTAAADQTGVPVGAERREFVLPGGLPSNFLRLDIQIP